MKFLKKNIGICIAWFVDKTSTKKREKKKHGDWVVRYRIMIFYHRRRLEVAVDWYSLPLKMFDAIDIFKNI